jgi:hypothetical protein
MKTLTYPQALQKHLANLKTNKAYVLFLQTLRGGVSVNQAIDEVVLSLELAHRPNANLWLNVLKTALILNDDNTFNKMDIINNPKIFLISNKNKYRAKTSHRIGVSKDLKIHMRFYIKENKYISKFKK